MKKEKTYSTLVVLLVALFLSHARGNPAFRQFEFSDDVQVLRLNGSFVCQVDGEIYQAGDDLPTEDPCEYCTCQPPGFACEVVTCDYKPGCRSLQRSGLCCPDFVCDCEFNGRIYRNGDRIRDNPSPCDDCYCVTGEVQCSVIDCTPPMGDCISVPVEGLCCPSYDCSANASHPRLQVTTESDTTESVADFTTESSFLDLTTDSGTEVSALDETTTIGMEEMVITLSPITDNPLMFPGNVRDFVETPEAQKAEESIFFQRFTTDNPIEEVESVTTEDLLRVAENTEYTTQETDKGESTPPEAEKSETTAPGAEIIELTTQPSEMLSLDNELIIRTEEETLSNLPDKDTQKTDDEFWDAFLSDSSKTEQGIREPASPVDSSVHDTSEKIRLNTKLIKERVPLSGKTSSDNSAAPQPDSADLVSEMHEIRLPIASTDEPVITTIDTVITTTPPDIISETSESSYIFKHETSGASEEESIDVSVVDNISPGQLRHETIDSFAIENVESNKPSPAETIPETFIQTFKSDIDELEEELIARENERKRERTKDKLISSNEYFPSEDYETTTQRLEEESATEDVAKDAIISDPLDFSSGAIPEKEVQETTEIPTLPTKRIKDQKHDYWINMMLGQSNPLDTIKEINKEKEALEEAAPSLQKAEPLIENTEDEATEPELRNKIVLSGDFEDTVIEEVNEDRRDAEQTRRESILEESTTAAAEETPSSQTDKGEAEITTIRSDIVSELQDNTYPTPVDAVGTTLPNEFRADFEDVFDEDHTVQIQSVETTTDFPSSIPVEETIEITTEIPIQMEEVGLKPDEQITKSISEHAATLSETLSEEAGQINEAMQQPALELDKTMPESAPEISITLHEAATEISENVPNSASDKFGTDDVVEVIRMNGRPSILEDDSIRPVANQEKSIEALEVTKTKITGESSRKLPDNRKTIYDTVMSKTPVLHKSPEKVNRKRINSQFEHLARKYGLRPLTKRTFRGDVKRKRQNRRKNRKFLLNKQRAKVFKRQ